MGSASLSSQKNEKNEFLEPTIIFMSISVCANIYNYLEISY